MQSLDQAATLACKRHVVAGLKSLHYTDGLGPLLVPVGLIRLELIVEVIYRYAEAAGEGVLPRHALAHEAVVLEHRRHLALGSEVRRHEAQRVAVVRARLEAQGLFE